MTSLDLTPPKETSATHAAYVTLRSLILSGTVPAGQRLKIGDLRKTLNTGASPIREALSLLTSDLLVERIDQRGFRAAPACRTNFEDILQIRCTLEEKALRQSIRSSTRSWEEKLVIAHYRLEKIEDCSSDAYEIAHKRFHMALLSGCGSSLLQRYCGQLYDLNCRYRNIAAATQAHKERNFGAEHKDILYAAVQKDEDRASDCLLRHYRLTGTYLSKSLPA